MPYATQDDLVPLRLTLRDLVELTTEDAQAQTADQVVVSGVLAEASARVDSYCSMRYVTPLQPSLDVKGLTLDIAIYLLYMRRRMAREGDDVTDAYKAAIAFLKDVASGKAALDQPAGAPAQATSGEAVVTRIPQAFSDSNIAGF